MLVGILSDIHDNLENLEKALGAFRQRNVKTLLFLGDFCSPIPARMLGAFDGTVHCVFGNGDGDRFTIHKFATNQFPSLIIHGEYAELELNGCRLALTHYPFYGKALAATKRYDVVLSGHTHEREVEHYSETLYLNPGEVMGWNGSPSCVLYDTATKTVEFLELQ